MQVCIYPSPPPVGRPGIHAYSSAASFSGRALSLFRTRYHRASSFLQRSPLRKAFCLGRPLLASLVLSACVWLLLAGIVRSGVLDSVETRRLRLVAFRRGEEPPPSNLVIVDFDEASVGAFACYPIPRPRSNSLLEKNRIRQTQVCRLRRMAHRSALAASRTMVAWLRISLARTT